MFSKIKSVAELHCLGEDFKRSKTVQVPTTKMIFLWLMPPTGTSVILDSFLFLECAHICNVHEYVARKFDLSEEM